MSVTWFSDNEAIAKVNQNGLVTALRTGQTTITAESDQGITASCDVHVCYPVTAINFSQDNYSIVTGCSTQLTALVTAGEEIIENQLIAFTSSDDSIITVDDKGCATSLRAGTVTITASAGNDISTSCTVTTREPVYVILPSGLSIIEEEAFVDSAFEAIIIPDGCVSIGKRAFAGCEHLIYIQIPASVTSIADDAFEGSGQVVIDRVMP